MFIGIIIVIVLLITLTPPKCEHGKQVRIFSFTSYNSTASSYTKLYCSDCESDITRPTLFKGNPKDLSYLDAIKENSDGGEIVGGEYYTIKAIVTLADYNYGDGKARITCKVVNESAMVWFTVDFKEGFEDAVDLIKEGDEITFRGRYYDIGCGFTDCELINN